MPCVEQCKIIQVEWLLWMTPIIMFGKENMEDLLYVKDYHLPVFASETPENWYRMKFTSSIGLWLYQTVGRWYCYQSC